MVLLLPGLGTDARVFESQQTIPFRTRALDWFEPEPGEPLCDFTKRWAADLKDSLRDERDVYLCGVSLGAAVAVQMSRYLDVHGVIAISGLSTTEDVNSSLRCGRWLLAPLNEWGIRLMRPVVAYLLQRFNQLDDDQQRIMKAMFKETSGHELKWQCLRSCTWRPPENIPVPIRAIHGRDDEIVKRPAGRVDQWVEGGEHMINITHADEVNAFITERIRELERSRASGSAGARGHR